MKLNRRNFLLGSAAAAAMVANAADKKGVRSLKPGDKANVAMIGLGIQGRGALLPQFLSQYDRGAKVTVTAYQLDKARVQGETHTGGFIYKHDDKKIKTIDFYPTYIL